MKYIKTIVRVFMILLINNYGSEKINVKNFTNEQYALHNPFYRAFNNVLYDLSKQKDIVTHSTDAYKLLKNLYIEKLEKGLLTNKRNLDETDLICYTKLKNGPFFRYIEPKIKAVIQVKEEACQKQKETTTSFTEKCAYAGHIQTENKVPEVYEISIKENKDELNLLKNSPNFFVKQSLIFIKRKRNSFPFTVQSFITECDKNIKSNTYNNTIIDIVQNICCNIVARAVNKENVQNSIDSNKLDLLGVPKNKYLLYLEENKWVTIAEKVELDEIIEDKNITIKLTKDQLNQLYIFLKKCGYDDLGQNTSCKNGLYSNIRIEKKTEKIIILDTDLLSFINKDEAKDGGENYILKILKNFLNGANTETHLTKFTKIFSASEEDLESIKENLEKIEKQNKNIKHKLVDESLVKSNMYKIFHKHYNHVITEIKNSKAI